MRKLLFASAKMQYPFGEGGAETVIHDILTQFNHFGIQLESWGQIDYTKIDQLIDYCKEESLLIQSNQHIRNYQNIQIPSEFWVKYQIPYPIRLTFQEFFLNDLEKYMIETMPQWVLTQAEGAEDIIELAKRHHIKTALYIHNGLELDYFSKIDPRSIDLIFANSAFVKKKIDHQYQITSILWPPYINFDPFKDVRSMPSPPAPFPSADGRGGDLNKYVTFINPVPVKGVSTFLQIVRQMPDIQFLCVEGWPVSDAVKNVINQLPNLVFLPKQSTLASIFHRTKLLLVPSIWEEAFGRVILEAQACGVPVIASQRGGIPEAVGQGGILISDYQNPKKWIEEIRKVLSSTHEHLSQKAIENSKIYEKLSTEILTQMMNQFFVSSK